MTELIIDFDVNAEEEGPYEALYNAVSCHSLDSMASGRSSDRDSVNKEAEAAGVAKAAGVRPVCGPGPSAAWGSCVPLRLCAVPGTGSVSPGATHVTGLDLPPPVLLGSPASPSCLVGFNDTAGVEIEARCLQLQYNLLASFGDFLASEQMNVLYLCLAFMLLLPLGSLLCTGEQFRG